MLLFFLCNLYSCQVEVLRLALDMQRWNDLYKPIKSPYIRRRNHANNRVFSQCINLTLFNFDVVLWLPIVLLLSGDIEINPGPDSVEGSYSSCDILSATSFETPSNHLSIFHLSIQSLVPKMDIIQSEADAFDILVFFESWLKPTIADDTIHFWKFKASFQERHGWSYRGRGRTADLEIRDIEAVWVEIQVKW